MDDFQELANKRVRAELGLDTGVEVPRGADLHLLAIQRGREELKKTLEAVGLDNEAATKVLEDEKEQRALIKLLHMRAAEHRANTAKLRAERAELERVHEASIIQAIEIVNARANEYRNMAQALRDRRQYGNVTAFAVTYAAATVLRRLVSGL